MNMLKRIEAWILMLVCLMMLAGCNWGNQTDSETEESGATPTVSPTEEIEEEDPFVFPFGEGEGIELPAVGGVEWDEDEVIPEFEKPSDTGNNDLPSVPGVEWDDDSSEIMVTPVPTPTLAPTVAPTPTPMVVPTVEPTQAPDSNDDNTDNATPDVNGSEQVVPTTTPAPPAPPAPEVTEKPENENNELPGFEDLGWD